MRRARRLLLALAASVLVLAVSACGGAGNDDEPRASADDPGPVHVHGLGVDPGDGTLYIATHTGLWRSPAGSTTAERVGDSYQDTMGFTVSGPGRFLGSGHPDVRQMQEEGLPPHLGLIESRDGGESWESVSLLGEVDFHVLRAHGDVVLGVDATSGDLFVSGDAGRSWESRSTPVPFFDLVAAPDAPATLVASAEDGLYASADGGTTWRRLGGRAGLLAWPARDTLYVATADGTLAVSADGGRTSTPRGLVGEPAALVATDAETLYVALHDGSVMASKDGGRTWSLRSRS